MAVWGLKGKTERPKRKRTDCVFIQMGGGMRFISRIKNS